jgi:class 3 adenylate cyclase
MKYDISFKEKNLAIVLLDIVGSTAFVQKVGARKAATWLQYHDRLTRSLCYKFQGREIDRSDGFLLSFNRVVDALNFSLYYQREVPLKTKLYSRIGIHWGRIVEVQQDELFVGVGAKMVELEGINKNIAARTMSLCSPGQILLTQEAFLIAKTSMNNLTPSGVRYACVGLYKFKGVKQPSILYAIGFSIDRLQPPVSTSKVKRLGGIKRIQSRARDRKLREWVSWIFWRAGVVSLLFFFYFCVSILFNPNQRWVFGLNKEVSMLDDTKAFLSDTFTPKVYK